MLSKTNKKQQPKKLTDKCSSIIMEKIHTHTHARTHAHTQRHTQTVQTDRSEGQCGLTEIL